MKELKILLLRDFLILRNQIKMILRSPWRLLVYGLLLFWITRSFWMRSSNVDTPEIDLEGFTDDRAYRVAATLIGLGLLVFINLIVFNATQLKSTFFRNADVQFLFTAPLRSNWMLLYFMFRRVVPSIFLASLSLVYFLFVAQSDQWLTDQKSLYLALYAMASLFFLIGPINFLIFALLTGKQHLRRRVLIIRLTVVILSFLVLLPGIGAADFKAFSQAVFVEGFMPYFPLLGWVQQLLLSAFEGMPIPWFSVIGLGGSVIGIPVLVFLLAGDYYEDVLQATELRSKREAMAQGSDAGDELEFSWALNIKKIKALSSFGQGAKVLLWKAWLMNNRQNFHALFGFFAWIFLAIGIFVAVMLYTQGADASDVTTSLYLGTTLMLFTSWLSGIGRVRIGDLNRPIFILLPDSILRKFFYLTLLDVLQSIAMVLFLLLPIVVLNPIQFPILVLASIACGGFYYIGFMINLLSKLSVQHKWDRLLLRPFLFLILFPALLLPCIGLAWAMYGFTDSSMGAFTGIYFVIGLWLLFLWLLLKDVVNEMELPS